jgi:hypothetical protein
MIEWYLDVVPDMGAYGMIIGRDLLMDLGIDIRFSNNTVHWVTVTILMKSRDATVESFPLRDPEVIQEAAVRVQCRLKAKYTAANYGTSATSPCTWTYISKSNSLLY